MLKQIDLATWSESFGIFIQVAKFCPSKNITRNQHLLSTLLLLKWKIFAQVKIEHKVNLSFGKIFAQVEHFSLKLFICLCCLFLTLREYWLYIYIYIYIYIYLCVEFHMMNFKHSYFQWGGTMLRCLSCVLNLRFYMRYLDSIDIWLT